MPFEISPKFVEAPAKTREQLGRIALEAIATHILTIAPGLFTLRVYQATRACGTVGCAIGHSIKLPEVQATGLYFDGDWGLPTVGKWQGWAANCHAFNITRDAEERLFRESGYDNRDPAPEEVAARIRAHLAETA